MRNKKYIQYTLAHKKAFLQIEKQLLGHNTLRGYFHDSFKVVLYLFLKKSTVSEIHRKYSRHHNRTHTTKDYIQMIIDWECARYTKPDKPLNARETLNKYYPYLKDKIEPLLIQFNL